MKVGNTLLQSIVSSPTRTRTRARLCRATTAVVESLESRRMFSTVSYTVTSNNTEVYLTSRQNSGEVDVRLGSPTSTPVFTFTGTTDQDEVVSPYGNVTFHDLVRAAFKPTGGILVAAGSDGTLEVDAGPNDTDTHLYTDLAVGDLHIEASDPVAGLTGQDFIGEGISQVNLKGNSAGGATYTAFGMETGIGLRIDTVDAMDDHVILGDGEGAQVRDVEVHTGAGNDSVTISGDGDDVLSSAFVDFDPGTGAGTGNTLNIGEGGLVTLEKLGSADHRIALDTAIVEGINATLGAKLIVQDPADIGTIVTNQVSRVVFNAATTHAGTVGIDGSLEVDRPATIDTLTGAGKSVFTGGRRVTSTETGWSTTTTC